MKIMFLIIFLLFPLISHATTVERLTLDDLVKKSHKIVVGKVSGARTYWTNNGRIILTSYWFEVQETLKGQASRTVEVTTIGGTIGDVTLHVAGMPSFEKGESAVVFVENTGAVSTVVGLGQGKFTVENGEVTNTLADLTFTDGRPGKALKMPLESLRKRIKLIVDR